MRSFLVPTREEVSPTNQKIFDNLKAGLGFVPNLYATIGKSANALQSYMTLQNAKSSLTGKEREVINLVVSQFNNCQYCLSAHTTIGKMKGFTDGQIMDIRKSTDNFDLKMKALSRLVKSIVETHGRPDATLLEAFFTAGYTEENMIDMLVIIGDKIVSNYLHGITQIPIDFELAPELK
ncbi:carboxymuconolactone decarboxylase family protein [Leptospira ognonensis]|uniref:Carboxymuconolactone decarboxylase family protein n=1 Tax=Leptospira ognonensis TaxID=2484945 RepID=A0A4R9JXE9_9LEPT|nr:carboxymuconolactone decarboxylase family protein [Leptospira ognonensis]TGL57860.1 carboxymuconolactone decarboxylase family protein [Leptospira ognonensis]